MRSKIRVTSWNHLQYNPNQIATMAFVQQNFGEKVAVWGRRCGKSLMSMDYIDEILTSPPKDNFWSFWSMPDVNDPLTDQKLKALGISESFIHGTPNKHPDHFFVENYNG